MQSKEKKGLGFYLVLAGAVLTVVGAIVYGMSYAPMSVIYLPLVLSVVAAAGVVFLPKKLAIFMPTVNALLLAFAIGWSLMSMLDPIGYVISGLYPLSDIITYIVFAVIAFLALLLNLVSGFVKVK